MLGQLQLFVPTNVRSEDGGRRTRDEIVSVVLPCCFVCRGVIRRGAASPLTPTTLEDGMPLLKGFSLSKRRAGCTDVYIKKSDERAWDPSSVGSTWNEIVSIKVIHERSCRKHHTAHRLLGALTTVACLRVVEMRYCSVSLSLEHDGDDPPSL